MAIMTVLYETNMKEHKHIGCSYTRGKKIRERVVQFLDLQSRDDKSDFRRKFAVEDVYTTENPETEVEVLELGGIRISSAKGSKEDIDKTKSKLLNLLGGLELN